MPEYSLSSKIVWYLVSKIVSTYCEKKVLLWLRKFFEIRAWKQRICKNFENTKTIYLNHINSERSVQFQTECFFNWFRKISQIMYNRKIRNQIWKKNHWDLETYRISTYWKVRKRLCWLQMKTYPTHIDTLRKKQCNASVFFLSKCFFWCQMFFLKCRP